MSEGVKHDSGKIPLSLLPRHPLEEIGRVLQMGAVKYDSHNWRAGMQWSRLVSALMRHLLAWNEGEDKDKESGLSHLAHVGCCVMFLLEYERTHKELDDRYKATE